MVKSGLFGDFFSTLKLTFEDLSHETKVKSNVQS